MTKVEYQISNEPVGYIVYAVENEEKLSVSMLADTLQMEILALMKIIAQEGGFKAEPKDAIAFFLFEERATAFIQREEIN
ncbi:hypothetical protein QBE53_11765 [Vallitaleaceae bacterium 9-2]